MEVSKQANYQERAAMISENSYLIPMYRKKAMKDETNYIITAVEENIEDEEEAANIEDKF